MTTTRDRLTDAMADLLWERGYAATSPHDVLQRAGVGQGSMYHHFSGKHELAVAAFRSAVDGLIAEAQSLEDETGGDTPLDRIEGYLQRPRPGTKGCRAGRMTQDPQVVQDPELLAEVARAFDTQADRWTRAVEQAMAAGQLPATIPAQDLALALSAVLQGGYVLARAHGSQEYMDRAVRGAVALLEAARAQTASTSTKETQ